METWHWFVIGFLIVAVAWVVLAKLGAIKWVRRQIFPKDKKKNETESSDKNADSLASAGKNVSCFRVYP